MCHCFGFFRVHQLPLTIPTKEMRSGEKNKKEELIIPLSKIFQNK